MVLVHTMISVNTTALEYLQVRFHFIGHRIVSALTLHLTKVMVYSNAKEQTNVIQAVAHI